MTINDKIRDEKWPYDINRIAAKTWPLSSGNTHKYLQVKKNSPLIKENS